MARRLTAAQAKAAKQKKLVILLGVIFLVVGGVQGPKFWKQLHPKPAGEAAPTPGSVPAGAGTPAAASAAAPGQLHTFRHLKLKDPFKALVKVAVGDNGSSAPAAGTPEGKPSTPEEKPAAPKQPEPEPKQPKQPTPPAEPAASGTVSFSAAKPPPNAAIVTTNGRKQLVYIGDGFPTADPVFRLVALAKKAVRVGVLGGSFTSGLPTIKLARGEPVTLANEADGTRYVIKLVRLTTAAPKPEPTSTTPAAPASAPATTTPATTTPATTTPTTTTAAASS
jgi:hypothetical protein